jgi:hypothetical protein
MAKESLAPCLYYFVMSIMFTSRVTWSVVQCEEPDSSLSL